MSVTKIRKFSSWTLLICAVITIIILGLFYMGGSTMQGENKNYNNTGLLLDWTYLMFIVTLVAMAIFALWQFVTILKTNPKQALGTLGVLALFVILLIATYSIGDGTPISGLNSDSQKYNTSFWLKITEMWINSTIVLFVVIVIAILAGSIKKLVGK